MVGTALCAFAHPTLLRSPAPDAAHRDSGALSRGLRGEMGPGSAEQRVHAAQVRDTEGFRFAANCRGAGAADESISMSRQCFVRGNGTLEVVVFLAGKQAEIFQRLQ
jgi:hypothetical protein